MDAYDVFKKLTKGIKFNRPKPPTLAKQQNKSENSINTSVNDKENISIKKEKPENTITLLNSFNNDQENLNRGKKRKLVEDVEKKQKLLKIEEINHYRNLNKISVVGNNVPDPCRTFDDFQIEPDLLENLKSCEYDEPTPVQKQAVPIMLQNRNLLACAPTGSGKTAAFLLPIIHHLKKPKKLGFRALILCPTRELAKQTQRECMRLSQGRGLRIHIISKINKALELYGSNSSKKYDILITTPNRLCFLLKQENPISLANIEWLIIDEADKLFEAGTRSFREQLDQILASCTNSNRKIAMFSATYTPVVASWCVHNMKKLIRVTVGQRNAATELVDQELLFVGNEQGKLLAFRDLVKKGISPPVLVFVQSKDRAQQLFNELIYDGINVDAIHADRTQLQRDNTVRSFREGKIWVLICTELMARGIDFKGVNLVINYDFPPSAISYVHRVGRAGRAGRRGKAITFFTIEDQVNLRSIAHVLKESGCEVPEYMLSMKKRSKKEKKKLLQAAPKRDDIDTRPIYEKMKIAKRKKRMQQIKGADESKDLTKKVVNKKQKENVKNKKAKTRKPKIVKKNKKPEN